MATDPKQYLTELLAEAGVAADDPRRQAIFEVFGNEKAAKRLADDVMRQSDYSRNMDALTKEKNDLIAKNTKYYQDESIRASENQKVVDAYKSAVDRYKAQFGELDDNGSNGNGGRQVIQTAQGEFISKKDYDESVKRMEGNFIGILKTGLKIATQHMHEFKEPLDVDALEKVAVAENISLQSAYDKWVSPRRTESQAAALKTQLDAAKAEGAREFASKHKIPVDTGAREFHPLLDRTPNQGGITDYQPNSGRLSPTGERTLRDSFVEAYNSVPAAADTSGH